MNSEAEKWQKMHDISKALRRKVFEKDKRIAELEDSLLEHCAIIGRMETRITELEVIKDAAQDVIDYDETHFNDFNIVILHRLKAALEGE